MISKSAAWDDKNEHSCRTNDGKIYKLLYYCLHKLNLQSK